MPNVEDPAVALFRSDMEALANRLLSTYTERVIASNREPRSKEVNDPIWGTIQIKASEALILDSPLLQRLRQIRQLGVAHLVYPAAVHTRFEHSLGTSYQVRSLVGALQDHILGATDGENVIVPWIPALLRLAGLCHDIGHGVMSHVIENALEQDRAVEDIRLGFQTATNSSKRHQLSEIAAYFLILSPAFKALLAAIEAKVPADFPAIEGPGGSAGKVERYQKLMANLVISKPIDASTRFPLIHELISGPFDADKLDYMARDATMCGVPKVTDVPRLVQKIRGVVVGANALPKQIAQTVNSRPDYLISGVARSGARTLDELALGRALLFDKIYRHQKVRAAEAMVASIVFELLAISDSRAHMLPYSLVDEELLTLSRGSIERILGVAATVLDENENAKRHADSAIDLSLRLRERRLLVRGFAFSSKMPLDPYRNETAQRTGVDNLSRMARTPHRRRAFIEQIVDLVGQISTLTGQSSTTDIVPHGNIFPYIWIGAPVVTDGSGESSEIGHAWLIGEHGEPIHRADEEYAETRGWSDAYVATRDLGLIFCPEEISTRVYVAAEAIIRQEYEVRVPPTMMAFAKQSSAEVATLKRSLVEQGWYDDKPADLRPRLALFDQVGVRTRMEEVVSKLVGYSGPLIFDAATKKVREPKLAIQRVEDFLSQFLTEERAESALRVLEHIKFVGRQEINDALASFLEGNEAFRGASICRLGQAKDSSSVLTYLAGDVAAQYECSVRDLDDAVLRDAPIIFVDDYVGLGNAAIQIFEDWFGLPHSTELNQAAGQPLALRSLDLLKSRSIGLVFACGRTEGRDRVASRLEELGLQVQVHLVDHALPTIFDEGVLSDVEDFTSFSAQTARKILRDAGVEEEKVEERLLGYGNTGLLLITMTNTPTATLTCLWQSGAAWDAIFPRRPKR